MFIFDTRRDRHQVTPMNDNATRSVNLTMLMIVSVCLPMIGALEAPAELDRAGERSETAIQPGSGNCLGNDACTGTDAGNSGDTAINVTADFAFAGEETNYYWGTMNGTGMCTASSSGDECNDAYKIDVPIGYGVSVHVGWNTSMPDRSFGVALGPEAMTGTGSGTGSWGRCYSGSSSTGPYYHAGMSTGGDHGCPGYQYNYNSHTWPTVAGGDTIMAWVFGYYAYQHTGAQEYSINISVWPADGGVRGDATLSLPDPDKPLLLDMPDSPSSWSNQNDSFDLAAGEEAVVLITYCDVWCDPESSVNIHKPDGTTDTFQLTDYFTGSLGTYDAAGTYYVEKVDTFGDGGVGLEVHHLLGNISAMLFVDEYNFEDSTQGHVNATDDDVFGLIVPQNFFSNFTLTWDTSADLDLEIYPDIDLDWAGVLGYSWFGSGEEYVDLGQLGEEQIIFIKVVHWSGPDTGYELEVQTQPGSPPPCFYQDDGAAPGAMSPNTDGDAPEGGSSWSAFAGPDDDPVHVGHHIDSDGYGAFTGTLCDQYDMSDWFQLTVPAYHGIWVVLEYLEDEVDANFNDSVIISSNIRLDLLMITSTGSQSSVGGLSSDMNPKVLSSNGSYSWDASLDSDTVVYLRTYVYDLTDEYELNYTITYSVYDASQEPPESLNQYDAGMDGDAGDSSTEPRNLTTANQTWSGYVHDTWDSDDYYKIFMPPNYAMQVCVSFPELNNYNLYIQYITASGYLSTIDSSTQDNPECAGTDYGDSDQDLFIRVTSETGSGDYELSIVMYYPGVLPAENQDDCGLAAVGVPEGDASDLVYPADFAYHTWLNDSTSGDFNPYHANGTIKDYWAGGSCTAWVDKTWDAYDIYSIPVPAGHYMQVDYDLDPTDTNALNGAYWRFEIMHCMQLQHRPCEGGVNGAYFVSWARGSNGLDEGTLSSNLWPLATPHNASGCDSLDPNPVCSTNWDGTTTHSHDSDGDGIADNSDGNGVRVGQSSLEMNAANAVKDTPGWAILYVYNSLWSGVDDHTYEFNVSFHPLSGLVGGDQNDANCDCDAGPGLPTSVNVNDHMNQTQADLLANNSTLSWNGWTHSLLDTTDTFTVDLPANHGVNIEVNRGNDADAWYILDVYDNTWTAVTLQAWGSGSQVFNTTTVTQSTDTWFGVGIRNWGLRDTVGTDYTVNVTFYTLDADGDGWLDQTEIDCGTDPYNASDYPADLDADGICDALDDDIDGDGVDNDFDDLPGDPDGSADMDGDGIPDDTDPDIDGDGWNNLAEEACLGGTSELQPDVFPTDYDGDLLCDIVEDSNLDHDMASTYLDFDGDNDGTLDAVDDFDFDPCADTDTDKDGHPDTIFSLSGVDHDDVAGYDGLVDADDDGNYTSDADDGDGDGVTYDEDADDGDWCVPETPTNLTEDDDDDGDGFLDATEIACGSDPLVSTDMPVDSTTPPNGICDALDPDDDGDGVDDTEDWAPYDPTEWADSDGDGNGDNRDMDDDNDGYWDSCEEADWLAAQNIQILNGVNNFDGQPSGIASTCPVNTDAFPNDATEWLDTDGDGVGDNTDVDDDGDGWSDSDELLCLTNPLDDGSNPSIDANGDGRGDGDWDGDGDCDLVDNDDDNDGDFDSVDAFPNDATEDTDTDGDGTGDVLDEDDDNDGWSDEDEAGCLTDPLDTMSVPSDNDRDGECDLVDGDDDNDGVIDQDDAFPNNPMEKTASACDGLGVNACNDDDGDGWLDATEAACANAGGSGDKDVAGVTPNDFDNDGICDAIDTDDDNDGHPDPACEGSASEVTYSSCAVGDEDRFPRDSAEWYDANEDKKGDNANPITLVDKMTYDTAPYLGIAVAIGAMGYGLLQMSQRAGQTDEDEAEDYTEEFEDYDFEEDEETEDFDDEVEED